MTIARRLVLLLALPVALLGVLFGLVLQQSARTRAHLRFVVDSQVVAVGKLNDIVVTFDAMRSQVGRQAITTNPAEWATLGAAYDSARAVLVRQLDDYADHWATDDRSRRLLGEYREAIMAWAAQAEAEMALVAQGRAPDAFALNPGLRTRLAQRLSLIKNDWSSHNITLALDAGRRAQAEIAAARTRFLLTGAPGLLFIVLLGVWSYRRIVGPVSALDATVRRLAQGDYSVPVPFATARDEVGSLARSVDVLKQGSAAMADQRWVKSSAAALTASLQGADSLGEFGRRFLSGLVPLLGGGAAAVFVLETRPERLRRIAGYGLADADTGAVTCAVGEGLAGACARERRAVGLRDLPPDYLRLATGLGEAAPNRTGAWPLLSGDTLVGVVEFASFRELRASEAALLGELLPMVAMSLEILQRNLRTLELLARTEEQAASLRANEEQFRTLLEAVPDALIICDEAGRIRLVNAQTERLFGYGREELVGQAVEMLVPERVRVDHPAKRARFFADAAVRALASGLNLAAVRKDGSEFPAEIGLSPLQDVQGGGRLVCCSLRDITDRQQAARAIAEERARLQAIVDTSPVCIGFTAGGRIRSVNPAFTELFGVGPGDDASRLYARPEERDALLEQMRRDGIIRNREVPMVDRAGTVRDMLVTFLPMRVAGEDGLLAWLMDITDRKQAAQRQADQLAFQQLLIDAIPNPVFYQGADTRFIGVNRAYEEAFGRQRADLVGKRLGDLDLLAAADLAALQAEEARVLADAASAQREVPVPFADGRVHDTVYAVTGFRAADGSPGGLVGTFIDVSDRKRVGDLERFNRLALGREERIVGLKREVNALSERAGMPPPYAAVEAAGVETALASLATERRPDSPADAYDITKQAFARLVQREQLQELFNGFCESVGIAAAIIDLEATVLASSRWQRVCTDFHRVNERACANCIESDTSLALQLGEGADFTMYRCKNGLTDCAAPIVVGGHHVANVFIGQFHLAPPDPVFFRRQAEAFGFEPDAYLAAIEEAPLMDEAKLPHILGFLARFARLIGSFAVEQRRAELADRASVARGEELRRERLAAVSLAEDAETARAELTGYQAQLESTVAERTGELEERMEDLERFRRLTVDREHRMIELKTEINALREKLGIPERYTIVE